MGTRTEGLLPDLRILALVLLGTALVLWLALSAVRMVPGTAPAVPHVAPPLEAPTAVPISPANESAPASAPATTAAPVNIPGQPPATEAPTIAPSGPNAPPSAGPQTVPSGPRRVDPLPPRNTLDMPIDPPLPYGANAPAGSNPQPRYIGEGQ